MTVFTVEMIPEIVQPFGLPCSGVSSSPMPPRRWARIERREPVGSSLRAGFVRMAADIEIFFCDPHSPWQRATNENTNGLLRQYFPKGTNLSVHSAEHLDWVADELNDRPRKRLGFHKPIERIGDLLLR